MAVPCERDREITTLEQSHLHTLELLRELSMDLKLLVPLAVKQEHQRETIGQIIDRIECLERGEKLHEAFVNQVQGMMTMAWTVWGVLSSGFLVVALKVFNIIGS